MDAFDLIVVGTGFASTFFLREWLRTAPDTARVLVLERGAHRSHAWQLKHRSALQRHAQKTFTSTSSSKEWDFAIAVGGSSACWWACTPRMLPEDFEIASRYGAGVDWPVSYDDLERLYVEVEHIMGVSGSQGATPFPMSEPYPLPPHGLSDPDKRLLAADPTAFFPQPTARSTQAHGSRGPCCGNSVCRLCPINAKFTILNGLFDPYEDPRVDLRANAFVHEVEVQATWPRGSAGAPRRATNGRPARWSRWGRMPCSIPGSCSAPAWTAPRSAWASASNGRPW